MLILPPGILAIIQRKAFDKASATDIAMLRRVPPLEVPTSYLEFISTWGYVQFDPVDDPCEFVYEYREPELAMNFRSSVDAFMPADLVRQYYTGLVANDPGKLPPFPAFMLPICFVPGQSHVLLECGGKSDRVWFWEFQDDAWGSGNNVRLGFVANTFQEFLNKLRVPVD